MALELSTLAFKVETTELDAAAKKLGVLQEAVQKLNTVRKGAAAVDKEATKAAVDAEKVAVAAERTATQREKTATQEIKTKEAKLKLAREEAKVSSTRVKELDNEAQATKRANSASLEYQKIKNEFMTKGLSSGEASTMTVARLNNVGDAIENLIEKELKFRRTISGSNPFDNSLSGMDKLIIQHRELVEAIKQSDNRAGLSMKQSQELSRDKERTIALMKNEGANHAQITAALKDQEQAYISSAKEVNNRQAILKEKLRTERESANAVRAVAVEEERMKSIVTQLTGAENQHMSVTEKAAIAQANYARNLKRAGIEGDEAAKRLRAYSEQQKVVNAVEEKRQAQYLQRGLQPQIGDVAVSLAAGQNPLTVLLQQGDQIRGLIAQTGVSGELLRKTMQNAMTETVKSIGQTAAAMSSVLGGAISSVGKAMLTVAGAPLTLLTGGFTMTGVAAEVAAANLMKLKEASQLLTKVGLVAVVVAITAALYEMYQGMKQHDDLVRQINLTGASLGMTADEAALFAKNISAAGDSGTKMLGVISAMAKEGGFTRDEIKLVGDAALDLYKYGGVAIEDTVKAFSKLKDDPVKALIELAKATGDVSPAVIQAVFDLAQMGDKAGAVAMAMKAMAAANKDTVKDMKQDFTDLAMTLKDIGTAIGKFYDSTVKGIRSLWVKDTASSAMQDKIDYYNKQIETFKNSKDVWIGGQGLVSTKEAKDQLALLLKQQDIFRNEQSIKQDFAKLDQEATKRLEKRLELQARYASTEAKMNKEIKEAEGAGAGEDVIAAIRKQYEKKQTATGSVGEDKEVKALERAREVYKDLVNVSEGLNSKYNEQEQAIANLLKTEDKRFKITEAQAAVARANLQTLQPAYLKQLAEEKQLKADLIKLQDDYEKAAIKQADYRNQIELENLELEGRLELIGKTEQEIQKLNQANKVAVSLAKARNDYEKSIAENNQKFNKPEQGFEAWMTGLALAEELNEKALSNYKAKVQLIHKENAVSAAAEYDREFKAVMSAISDGIAEALLEGGDVGARKLRDNIVKVLRQKIVLQIDAVINPIMDAAGKSIADSLSLGKSQGGMFSDVMGAVSSGKSISDAISGGFTAMGAKAAHQFATFATGVAGQSLGLSTTSAAGAIAVPSASAGYGANAVIGAQAGTAASTSLTAAGTTMSQTIATALPIAMAAIAGYGAYTGISGNKSINPTLDAIGKVASLFGPLYGVIGGLANRAFGMGPKEVRESGIQGSFGADTGANLQSYARWTKDSGWFNKGDEGVDITALDKKITDPFNAAIIGIASQTKAFAGILGLDAGRIAGFTKNIKLQLDNLKPEDQQKAIDEAIQSFGSGMAEILLGSLTEVTRQVGQGGEYETAFQTLTRLASSLTAVNSVFDMLNITLMDASVVGANAASKLIDAFGGLEQFGAALGGFYENFYTEQEKSIETTASLKKQFAALGVAMPVVDDSMRSWYKTQVLSALQLDQSVVANATYTASLIALQATVNEVAPAFGELNAAIQDSKDILAERTALQDELNQLTMSEAQLYDLKKAKIDQSNWDILEQIRLVELKSSIDAEARSLQDELNQLKLTDIQLSDLKRASLHEDNRALYDSVQSIKASKAAVNKASEALDRAMQAEKTRLEQVKQSASTTVDTITAVFDLIKTQVSDLYGSVGSTSSATAKTSQQFIDSAISEALSTGKLPDQAKLSEAISSVRTELGNNIFGSQFEADKAKLVLANKLEVLGAVSSEQLTEAQKMLKLAEAQVVALDNSMEMYKQQLDQLRGIDTSVLSVVDAVAQLGAAMRAQAAATGQGAVSGVLGMSQTVNGNTSGTSNGLKSILEGNFSNSDVYSVASASASMEGITPEQLIYNTARAAGWTASELDKRLGFTEGTSNAWAAEKGLPQFEVGTNYVPQDMVAKVHKGEAIVPAAFNPVTFGGMGSSAKTEQLLSLIVTMLETNNENTNSTAMSTFRTAKMLDSAMPDRDTIQVKVIA